MKAGGEVGENSFYMPNANQIRSPLRKKVATDAVVTGRHDRLLCRVPIDDDRSLAFTVDMAHITGTMAEEYRRVVEQKKLEEAAPPFDLAECILAGKLTLADVKARVPTYSLSHIEDYISLVGQGPIADREHEHLGRMDVGVILLRKLWERELRALAEGRSPRNRSGEIGLRCGLYSYRFDSETVRSSCSTLTVVGRNEQVCRPLRGAGDM